MAVRGKYGNPGRYDRSRHLRVGGGSSDPAGRGNPAKFPSAQEALTLIRSQRARKLIDRTVEALAKGDKEELAIVMPESRRLTELRRQLPWTVMYAEERLAQYGITPDKYMLPFGKLLKHKDPAIRLEAVKEAFRHTMPRQPANVKVDGRHLHAIMEVNPDELQIAARPIEEPEAK